MAVRKLYRPSPRLDGDSGGFVALGRRRRELPASRGFESLADATGTGMLDGGANGALGDRDAVDDDADVDAGILNDTLFAGLQFTLAGATLWVAAAASGR
jgi:hypothetical protein